ncbi:hypothetical protein CBS101457_002601 [Exobasidium rhododendri]|nr:hypothetical protein CBS101457_002601 [Exobasidium rhododendri]
MSWESDTTGYPERTFPTRVLNADSSSFYFRGKGKEPYTNAALDIASGSEAERSIYLAKLAITKSHLVAFPTETVYGLGANALDADAVSKIFRAKGRPVDNPLIVHISDLDMLQKLLPDGYELSPVYSALISKFWPGALTLLFPVDEAKVPSIVRCGLKTLGIRMPSHPVARALIAASGLPLAAPSANASGRPSPTTAMHVHRDLTARKGEEVVGRLPFILDGGPCHVGLESTVVDGVSSKNELRVLRPGGIGVEEIEEALRGRDLLAGAVGASTGAVRLRVYGKDMKRDKIEEANPTTPGMKYRHYSPDADVILLVCGEWRKAEGGGSDALRSPSILLHEFINDLVSHHSQHHGGKLRIGVMSMDDSKLTKALFPQEASSCQVDDAAYHLQHFSLGSQKTPNLAAQRLFEGLRTLDEGGGATDGKGCDVILVEALDNDAGVGLAFMNRLQKAASRAVHIQV